MESFSISHEELAAYYDAAAKKEDPIKAAHLAACAALRAAQDELRAIDAVADPDRYAAARVKLDAAYARYEDFDEELRKFHDAFKKRHAEIWAWTKAKIETL